MMSLTVGLFTQVSGSGPVGPLVPMQGIAEIAISGSGNLGCRILEF